jgi:hypothetical protein
VRYAEVKNEIRVIGDKGKGNKTLCLYGDILTSRGNVLIHFLEPSYPKECLKDSSVDIQYVPFSRIIKFCLVLLAVSMFSAQAFGCQHNSPGLQQIFH